MINEVLEKFNGYVTGKKQAFTDYVTLSSMLLSGKTEDAKLPYDNVKSQLINSSYIEELITNKTLINIKDVQGELLKIFISNFSPAESEILKYFSNDKVSNSQIFGNVLITYFTYLMYGKDSAKSFAQDKIEKKIFKLANNDIDSLIESYVKIGINSVEISPAKNITKNKVKKDIELPLIPNEINNWLTQYNKKIDKLLQDLDYLSKPLPNIDELKETVDFSVDMIKSKEQEQQEYIVKLKGYEPQINSLTESIKEVIERNKLISDIGSKLKEINARLKKQFPKSI